MHISSYFDYLSKSGRYKYWRGVQLRLYFLLLPRLAKLPSQCYSNGQDNLGNLGGNKEIQPYYKQTVSQDCITKVSGKVINPVGNKSERF